MFQRWNLEPNLPEDHAHSINPIAYWITLKTQDQHLSQMALDILSIPASSCDCERMFSEIGDLLEPKRRKIGAQLLAAIHCVRAWHRAKFMVSDDFNYYDNDTPTIDEVYSISQWEQVSEDDEE